MFETTPNQIPIPIEEGYEIISIVFYKRQRKDTDDWLNKMSRELTIWWTESIYSHIDFYIDGFLMGSSLQRGGVSEIYRPNLGNLNWTYYHIAVPKKEKETIISFIKSFYGCDYDLLNFFMVQAFRTTIDDRNKWICSEFGAMVLDKMGIIPTKKEYKYYDPGELEENVALQLSLWYDYNSERGYFIKK